MFLGFILMTMNATVNFKENVDDLEFVDNLGASKDAINLPEVDFTISVPRDLSIL